MDTSYIKLYIDQEEFFTNEDMSFEDTGRLTAAMFEYARTGEDPIDKYFDRGTQGRAYWRVLKRHIDACAQKSAQNAANASGDSETKRNRAKPSETKRHRAKPSETERNEATSSENTQHTHIHTQEHTHTQEQKQEHAHTQERRDEGPASTHSASDEAASEAAPDKEWDSAYELAVEFRITDGKDDSASFRETCRKLAPDCTPEWIRAAIAQCRKQHVCSWAYFTAILGGYQEAGRIDTDDPDSKARNRPYTGRQRKISERTYDQRPNTEPDGYEVPGWLSAYQTEHKTKGTENSEKGEDYGKQTEKAG